MKTILAVLISLSLISCAHIETTENISPQHEAEIIVLCRQLLADYAIYRDHLDAEGFANAFSQDAEFITNSNTYRGHEEIYQYVLDHDMPGNAHMIMFTTKDIQVTSLTEATAVSYAMILGGDRPVQKGDKPIQMNGIVAANEYRTNFKLTSAGWKMSRMDFNVVFRGPGQAK